MYTQCPQCLTYFQVTPEHLKIAQGNVRCGQCRTVFSALGNLTEEPPQIETQDDTLDDDIFIDESELDLEQESYLDSNNSEAARSTSPKPSKLGQAIAAIQALNKNHAAKQIQGSPSQSNSKPPLQPVISKKSKKSTAPEKPDARPAARSNSRITPMIPSRTEPDNDEINYDAALDALDQLRLTEAIDDDRTFIARTSTNQNQATPTAVEQPKPEPEFNPEQTIVHRVTRAGVAGKEQQSKTKAKPTPKTRATQRSQIQPKQNASSSKKSAKHFQKRPSRRRKASRLKISWWGVGGVLLMFMFLGQTVYFKHNDLAKNQSLRPWVESFCKTLSCEVALPSDVKKLELIGQDIRSHPDVASALKVSTTIINNASFPQSYPLLQITFSDINGQRVAERRFKPQEYLPIHTKFEKGMIPNTPIRIELEMLDPGSNAVNFEFDFFPFLQNG